MCRTWLAGPNGPVCFRLEWPSASSGIACAASALLFVALAARKTLRVPPLFKQDAVAQAQPHTMVGTPAYVAPEVLASTQVGAVAQRLRS